MTDQNSWGDDRLDTNGFRLKGKLSPIIFMGMNDDTSEVSEFTDISCIPGLQWV